MNLQVEFKEETGQSSYDLVNLKYTDYYVEWLEERTEQLILSGVVNCVYVVTERDNYGEQLFKGVFANKEKAIEYLTEDGLTESNIDEINEIELD
tara:strand:- start:903 stop:1187 length:285 start_codon:yes stop_codon:yes gene_type:complete